MLLAQRDDDAVVGGRGLKFDIEGTAEPLPQRQSPGTVDSRAEGGVEYELHSARFIEEALGNHGALRRKRAESRPAAMDVFDRLLRAPAVERALAEQELDGVLFRSGGDFLPKLRIRRRSSSLS